MPRAAPLALTLVALIALPSRAADSGPSSIPRRPEVAALRPSRRDVAVRDVAYDSAYRLVHDDRDVADGSLDAITNNLTVAPTVPYVAANANDYVLDAAGNRHQTTFGGVTQTYTLAGMPTQDRAMNQYTTIGNAVRSHDQVGNVVGSTDTGRQAYYDCDNRLVQWTEGTKDVRYRYDADGRRILKEDASGSPSFAATVTFWDGWQEIEEYVASAGSWSFNKRYVYGEGIDEVIRATLPDAADINGNSNTTESVDLYYHHNSLGSVVAVSDGSGVVKESYRYSAYGTPTIYDQNGSQVSTTQVRQPFMFTGRRWDFEEGSSLYYYRLRYYDPASGRFVSRDPLGLWGDPVQMGNAQSYCGNNPVNRSDPLGLNSLTTAWDGLGKAFGQAADGDLLGAIGTAWKTGIDATTQMPGNPLTYIRQAIESAMGLLELAEKLAEGTLCPGDLAWDAFMGAIGGTDWAEAQARWEAGDEIGAVLEALEAIERLLQTVLETCATASVLRRISQLRIKLKNRKSGGTRTRQPEPKNTNNGSCSPDDGVRCFLAGTLVLTPRGGVPIESLKSGDLVLARNARTGETAYKRVLRVHRGHGVRVCRVTIGKVRARSRSPRTRVVSSSAGDVEEPPGSSDVDESILSTPGHDYFRASDGVWIDAERLRPGDLVLSASGHVRVVTNVEVWFEAAPTWNLEVEEFHTYFVGESGTDGVWVHNGQSDETDLHHTIPRQVRQSRTTGESMLPPHLQNDPDIVGKPGNPNRWPVPRDVHRDVHSDGFNDDWVEEIQKLRKRKPDESTWTKEDILKIRDRLVKKHGLDKYDPRSSDC